MKILAKAAGILIKLVAKFKKKENVWNYIKHFAHNKKDNSITLINLKHCSWSII